MVARRLATSSSTPTMIAPDVRTSASHRRPSSMQPRMVLDSSGRGLDYGFVGYGGMAVGINRTLPGSAHHRAAPLIDGREFNDVASSANEALQIANTLMSNAERQTAARLSADGRFSHASVIRQLNEGKLLSSAEMAQLYQGAQASAERRPAGEMMPQRPLQVSPNENNAVVSASLSSDRVQAGGIAPVAASQVTHYQQPHRQQPPPHLHPHPPPQQPLPPQQLQPQPQLQPQSQPPIPQQQQPLLLPSQDQQQQQQASPPPQLSSQGGASRGSLGSSVHPLTARTRSSLRAESPTLTVSFSDSLPAPLGGHMPARGQPRERRRFFDREVDMEVLVGALHDCARVRGECHVASDQISRDFTRDFSPADHPFRRPARSLVIKSNNVATRLQAALRAVEDAAWESVERNHGLTMEKECVMASLAAEVEQCDVDLRREIRAMRAALKQMREQEGAHAAVERAVLQDEVRLSERDIDLSVAHIATLEKRLSRTEAFLREIQEKNRKMIDGHDAMVREMEKMSEEREREKEQVRQLTSQLEKQKEKLEQRAKAASGENEKLQAEIKRLTERIADLEGTSGGAAKRLRAAEAEGGNLRSLATAACEKLEVLEKVAEQLREDLSTANSQLAERDAGLVELNRRLQIANSEKKEIDTLRAVCLELQNVLKDAMKAATWKQCRQMLYHESLRYVSSAATHGKHGAKGTTRPEPGLASKGLLAGHQHRESARVIDGKGISKLLSRTESIVSPDKEDAANF